MNIVLLDESEKSGTLSRDDRRSIHIVRVLKKKIGDTIDAGCGGSLGKAEILSLDESGIQIRYTPERDAPPLRPIELLAGFPRPIQAGRMLKDLASLGVRSISFALTELGEKSYAASEFFASRKFVSSLAEGAEQAGNPLLPSVQTFWSLERALSYIAQNPRSDSPTKKIALHLGEGIPALGKMDMREKAAILAVGSERGWTERETELLRGAGFELRSLGDRILKTETAAVAGISILLSKLGYL